ncbi:MAG: aconitate hydratase [Candidatus Fischerbacteria bacterium RBG_13_37_8]|uniref:Aconitate hydratase n=1 Tax=Candidatus Fischerbacteria bacterium RBG_13_37_8 TaxID=1817863 RepID=A0A1F5VXI3_9BACT|nr:MAG: aconitate hydratase [Candidatus Fischerbacteria bacterium RBG_13_37_8]
MKKSLVYKILEKHLISGVLIPGNEIAIKIDQTLTQDATGTMAYLQFESIGIDRVKTELSVSYIDHNTLQVGFENADDHRYLQSVAAKFGVYFSRPGNGICHQVHLERFGVPGKTLLGSDSHTPTGGGIGMIAIGAGGLDVAVAMGGGPFYLVTPRIVKTMLAGKLPPMVSAKDIILELLRRLSVKGGVGKIFEYCGEGVQTLTVPERATITNMGAELGATTSIFPSDKVTKQFLKAQNRVQQWKKFQADPDAAYDEEIIIDLNELEPLIARPHQPDNVCKVKEIAGLKINQVNIGSCTNSSYMDLERVAAILRGKTIHPEVSCTISPGSKQVFEMIAKSGALKDLIAAGCRILESACGPCIGMGMAPSSAGISIRTFNRNFEGRSGTRDAGLYLASPEVAAACALKGVVTDPRSLNETIEIPTPKRFILNDNMIVTPPEDGNKIDIIRGPNIKPLPEFRPLPNKIEAKVILKTKDNITTDHIMPAGAKILPLRSNIPAISQHVFEVIDVTFPLRMKEAGGGVVIGGENYGQGSSREHAALAPKYLGLTAVITKSFARIHFANLINFGILPLTFTNPEDYNKIEQEDLFIIENVRDILQNKKQLIARIPAKNLEIPLVYKLSDRQVKIILAGGLLNYTRESSQL